nr:retrotransposon protein, putative, Ty1-copia subclass [Tanacetum cinerariifolium]
MFLVYGGNMERELIVSCYTDAGYLTDADNLKSQTAYVFVLNRGAVDWKSTKQSIYATSSTDAEYIAAFDASKEAVWILKFISRLGIVPTIEEPISMYCDNTVAISIVKDDGVTDRLLHGIYIKYNNIIYIIHITNPSFPRKGQKEVDSIIPGRSIEAVPGSNPQRGCN